MRNSPRIEHASQSIITLLRQVTEFEIEELHDDAPYLEDFCENDIIQEKIPLFIQQMTALHSLKHDELQKAVDREQPALVQQYFNEKTLLGSMISYFAAAAAPIEVVSGEPYTWHICKGYVLVYRRKATHAPVEGTSGTPSSPKKKTPKNKLN